MFEITVLVEGKKLEKVLWALDGLTYNLNIKPVRNAKVQAGEVKQAGPTPTAYEAILAYLKEQKPSIIDTKQMRGICETVGLGSQAYTYGVKKLMSERLLKRGPKRRATHDPQVYNVTL